MGRGILTALVCLAWSLAEGDQQVGNELGMAQREVSFDELTVEAAKLGMEIIPPEEWMSSRRRRLQATGWCRQPVGVSY